jgi:hypothetical protein
MQNIDSRWIYALLLLFVIVPLLAPDLPLPTVPSAQSVQFYDTVEHVAATTPNKLVVVSSLWEGGSRGEQQWQARAIFTHLMLLHLHFATMTFDTQNATLTHQLVESLAPKYGYVYGRDWVDWGYKPYQSMVSVLQGLTTDIPGTIDKDANGTPVGSIAVMRGVKSIDDVGLIVIITPANDLPYWIGLVQGVDHTPMVYAPTAVMAPDSFPYLDSGQLSGLMIGIKGAGDYEYLLETRGHTNAKSFGTRAMSALSLIYLLLIILVVIGNIGYRQELRARRAEGQ